MAQEPDPSTQQEAAIIARQRLMRRLIDLLDAEGVRQLESWLRERQVLSDGQEDPGAVMVEGLEVELAVAQEYGALLQALDQARKG